MDGQDKQLKNSHSKELLKELGKSLRSLYDVVDQPNENLNDLVKQLDSI